jgi:hypothetical protein
MDLVFISLNKIMTGKGLTFKVSLIRNSIKHLRVLYYDS